MKACCRSSLEEHLKKVHLPAKGWCWICRLNLGENELDGAVVRWMCRCGHYLALQVGARERARRVHA